jgi:hypothetical protein
MRQNARRGKGVKEWQIRQAPLHLPSQAGAPAMSKPRDRLHRISPPSLRRNEKTIPLACFIDGADVHVVEVHPKLAELMNMYEN